MKTKEEVWLHIPTLTIGLVRNDVIIFKWNNKIELSSFVFLRAEGDWIRIGDL